jgi:tetratricopeptide (TPR) repeat protein
VKQASVPRISARLAGSVAELGVRYGALVALVSATALGLLGCSSNAPAPKAASPEQRTESAEWSFQQGRAAMARGDTVRAEQYIALALQRGYDERAALPLLIEACLKSSRLRAALNHAEPYLRKYPEAHELRYLVATIHAALGATDRALRELERLLREHEQHADAHYLLGVLRSEADPALTARHFRRYLELAPDGSHAGDVRGELRELTFRETQPADRDTGWEP